MAWPDSHKFKSASAVPCLFVVLREGKFEDFRKPTYSCIYSDIEVHALLIGYQAKLLEKACPLLSYQNVQILNGKSTNNEVEFIEIVLQRTAGVDTNSCSFIAPNGGNNVLMEQLLRNDVIIHETMLDLNSLCSVVDYNLEITEYFLTHAVVSNVINHWAKIFLLHAASGGYGTVVHLLLRHGVDVNTKSIYNSTPLHLAIHRGHNQLVELLLKNGASVSAVDENGSTALHIASKEGHHEMVMSLLQYGPQVDVCDQKSLTCLRLAVERGHNQVVKVFLDRGVRVDMREPNGLTLLHIAAQKGYTQIAQDLLRYGADIGAVVEPTIRYGCGVMGLKGTPLDFAVKNKSWGVVKLLLNHGVDIDATYYTYRGSETILRIAVEASVPDVVNCILSHRPDVRNESNKKAILEAVCGCTENHRIIRQSLTEYGFSASPDDYYSLQFMPQALDDLDIGIETSKPSHTAACVAEETVIRLLSKHGASVFIQNELQNILVGNIEKYSHLKILKRVLANLDQLTITKFGLIHYVIKNDYSHLIEILLQSGIDINITNIAGQTPLMIAAQERKKNSVEVLLKYGAHISDRAEDGRTTLSVAYDCGDPEILTAMLENYFVTQQVIDATNIYEKFNIPNHSVITFFVNALGLHERTELSVLAVLHHFIKATAAELQVKPENLSKMQSYIKVHNLLNGMNTEEILNECISEIVSMKSENIGRSEVSFYDILTKDVHKLRCYARNANIAQVFESTEYQARFPMYGSIISRQFKKGIDRKELLDAGIRTCCRFSRCFFKLPLDIKEKILNYLSNQDLLILKGIFTFDNA